MHQPRKGRIQQKLLLLLMSGLALGLTRNPSQYYKIVRNTTLALKNERKDRADSALNTLRDQGYIKTEKRNGRYYAVLTEAGHELAKNYGLNQIELTVPKRWDKQWRIVSYDVPEEEKWKRQALGYQLKRLGFYEMHRSVFVFPYPCFKELRTLFDWLEVNEYVRCIEAVEISRSQDLKRHFNVG